MSTVTLHNAKGAGDFLRLRFWGTVLLMLGALLALSAGSAFAAPLAGTSIGNQASASYTDANSVARITVSNSVSTVVTAVHTAAMTLSQSRVVAPGQTFAFPHTIVNNGNAPDTYTLTAAVVTNAGNLSAQPLYYADSNCDGVADNNTATTSIGPIAAGAQSCFVAQGTAGTTANATASFDITFAGSGATTGVNPNVDSITISANAVISVTKSVSLSTGPNGTIVTYQLTYRNTGTVSAGNVVIADTLPSNAGYVLGSATWSGTAATLTDSATDAAQGSAPYRIDYGLVNTAVTLGATVVAILERVDPGVQGVIEFRAQMVGSGPLTINNNANWCYSDIGVGGTIVPASTGTTAAGSCFNVRATFDNATALALTDFTSASGITHSASTARTNVVPFYLPAGSAATGAVVYNDNNGSSTDGTAFVTLANAIALADADANVAVQTAVGQGTLASWSTYVWNTGGTTDTYNITLPAAALTDFPAGTSFLLFRSDGFTPLTDSNSDGIVDSGPVAAGASYLVRVVAVLPPSIRAATYNAVLTATTTNAGGASNTVVVRAYVDNSRVDLKNNPPTGVSASDGFGQQAAGEGAAVTGGTLTADPGTTASFRLAVRNTGPIADSFNLSFNLTTGAYTTADAFTTPTALPTGFTLKFYRTVGNVTTCAAADLGAEVSNTGVIQPTTTQNYCAVVTVPVGATAAAYEIYFRAISPTTWDSLVGSQPGSFTNSSADVLHNRLSINSVRTVAIAPNNSGQGFPGGSVQYCHTVTNSGNVNETGLSITQANQTLFGTTGWAQYATIYLDSNNNCVLDGAETTLPATATLNLGTVTAGASVRFIVMVQVPGAAAAGQTNVNTFTLNGGGATVTQATATDTTNVVLGQISLVKDQAADATCSVAQTAAGYGGLTYQQSQLSAAPNTCIVYRVRATNVGTQAVTSVVINDVAPPNTALDGTNPVSSLTNPCTTGGTAPNVSCTIASLSGGATTTMYFRIRINP